MTTLIDERAERMVIGWLQLAPSDVGAFEELLSPEDFGDPRHGAAFAALCEVIGREGEVEYGAVTAALHERKVFNALGGLTYLSECASDRDEDGFGLTPRSAFGAARLVAELAERRRVADAARNAIAALQDLSRSADEAMALAQELVLRAAASRPVAAGRSFSEALSAVMNRGSDPDAGRASFPLPWPSLSARIGGVRRKRVHFIGARYAMGKSAFALNIALSLSAPNAWWPEVPPEHLPAPVPVLAFVLEMSDEENAARGLATLVGSNVRDERGRPVTCTAQDVEGGTFAEALFPVVQRAIIATAGAPFRLDDKTRQVARMRVIARQFFAKHGPGVLIVDYLQLCKAQGLDLEKNATRERVVAEMCRTFKEIAMELDIAVIILAQLNRGAADEDKRPRAEELRESGAQEQDADVIMLLWGKRPEAEDETQEVKVAIDKVRGGRAGGDVPFIFTRRTTRFEEAEDADSWLPIDDPRQTNVIDMRDRGGGRRRTGTDDSPRDWNDDGRDE